MSHPRRGAIVGFGNVAEHGHCPAWSRTEGFEIVAVADPSPERRRAAELALPGVRTYTDHTALLAAERIDFVDIASPPAYHAPAMRAATEHQVHIVCEKPLTATRAEYLPVRQAVIAAGTVLYPVHNWKSAEAFRLAAAVIAAGSLGELRRLRFETHRNGWAAGGNDWRTEAAIAGGGILVDHGWHTFYLLLGLAGARPLRVRASAERRRYRDAEVEDTVECDIDFGELRGEIFLTWAAPKRRTRWLVEGALGALVIEDDRIELIGTAVRRGGDLPQTLALSLSQGSHHPEWFPDVIAGFAAELEDPQRHGAERREAEWCLALLDHAYRSAADNGRAIELPADLDRWFARDEARR
ncbi:MAG TPA: Gfo/Idh/MocA family oxidoreductase [Terriglobales bacterium]|nr:Gfo/Idh/MocA family oxidoreductase [Terriglobales bacterium]